MSDVNKWKSSQEMVDLFRDIGMDPKYLFSHETIQAQKDYSLLILESFASKEGYLVLDEGGSDKNDFLNLFEGGTERVTVSGVYFDSGWIAWFPEGYSTMTLVEFYDEPKPAPNFQIGGRVYHGEKAFARLNVLDDIDIVKIPDSINRWKI